MPLPSSIAGTTGALPDTSLFHRCGDGGRRRVLVVDDDPVARRLIATVLGVDGYEVLEADGGEAALEVITRLADERLGLDCLLLDVRMPGLDGPSLLERLAADGLVVPTMAVSASADRDTVIRLMRLGCAEFIDKPIAPDHLVGQVASFIDRSRRATALRRGREERLSEEKARLERESERSRRQAQEASDSYSRLNRQVETARTVYQDLIGNPAAVEGIALAWRNRPLAAMGGDFLGVRPGGRGVQVMVADVAGHDLGASLHGVLLKALFEENCRRGLDGAEFMARLNRQLLDAGGQRRLATALLVDIDPVHGTASVVSAGHPPALLQRAGRPAEAVEAGGSVLGMGSEVAFAPRDLALAPGDRIILCTDGVVDAARIDGRTGVRRRFGTAGLAAALGSEADLHGALAAAWDAAQAHCRGKPGDDMLLAGVELGRREADYEPQAAADAGEESPTCTR